MTSYTTKFFFSLLGAFILLVAAEAIAGHGPRLKVTCEDAVFRLEEVSRFMRNACVIQTELSKQGRLAGYELKERFYEIGSPAGLHELDVLLGGPDRERAKP